MKSGGRRGVKRGRREDTERPRVNVENARRVDKLINNSIYSNSRRIMSLDPLLAPLILLIDLESRSFTHSVS